MRKNQVICPGFDRCPDKLGCLHWFPHTRRDSCECGCKENIEILKGMECSYISKIKYELLK